MAESDHAVGIGYLESDGWGPLVPLAHVMDKWNECNDLRGGCVELKHALMACMARS
jgi:hypothetical protein